MKKIYLLIITLLLTSSFLGAAGKVTYEDYLTMSESKRKSAIKKLVRRKDGYYTIQKGKYFVHTDVDPEKTLEMAVLMDDFQTRFSKVFKGSFRIKKQAKMFVLSSNESYKKSIIDYSSGRIDPGWSAGMYVHGGSKSALFGNAGYGNSQLIKILFHEGTHQLLHYYLKTRIPVWFNEGIATNFETWELTRSPENNRANAIYVSNRALNLLQLYPDRGFVKFSKIIYITSRQWSSTADPTPNYTSAWATCNFFLGCPDGRKFLNIIIKKMRSSGSKGVKFSSSLVSKIEEKIAEYIDQVVIPHTKYTRNLKNLMAAGDLDAAGQLLAEMQENYPDNSEGKFYKIWLAAEKSEAEVKMVKKISDLKKNGFEDPMVDYVKGKIYLNCDDKKNAEKYFKLAVKGNSKDKKARELLDKLDV
ncbi:MAG: YfgM family protein [Planctomycetota bacterium]|jgi:hypothetical protein